MIRTVHLMTPETAPEKPKNKVGRPRNMTNQCGRGHERTPMNTYVGKNGVKDCLTCRSITRAIRQERKWA